MKTITVISGKGGTGKTVITACLASLAKKKVMVDCDVDAADLHLLLAPEIKKRFEFKSGKTAKISSKLCEQCAECIDHCRFDAITDNFIIDAAACEGCGFCSLVCPNNAITMEENISGEWFISNTKYGTMVHAKLGIAEENSGKLVAKIRKAAEEMAQKEGMDYVIIDGPPGIGCPVIASLSGVDMALIVVEPTVSGIHDMKRVIELTNHFGINCAVVINKFSINMENTRAIEDFCASKNIEVYSRIPFSKSVVKALVNRKPIVEYCEDNISKKLKKLWERLI